MKRCYLAIKNYPVIYVSLPDQFAGWLANYAVSRFKTDNKFAILAE